MFCNNPDALGIDELEKGILDSLKNITQLPPSPSKDEGRVDDSAGTAENQATGEAGKKFPVAGTGEWLYEVWSSGFLSCFC